MRVSVVGCGVVFMGFIAFRHDDIAESEKWDTTSWLIGCKRCDEKTSH